MAEQVLEFLNSLEEHTVTYGADNKQIFYYATGPVNGPLAIFIHGWPAAPKTWYPQLSALSQRGFRCIAPDMPGYGRSTSTHNVADYSQEKINEGMLALLLAQHRDRAVWIGHDWGAGCVWSFASHYPERVAALANLVVPYRTVEAGIENARRFTNRDVYPADKYPDSQWAYIRYYMQSFDKAVDYHDEHAEGLTKFLFSNEDVLTGGGESMPDPRMAPTALCVIEDKPFGAGAPPASDLRDEDVLLPMPLVDEITYYLKENGYFAPDAYYNNDEANKAYAEKVSSLDLHFPVLFVEGLKDSVCDTHSSNIAEPMRRHCKNLSWASVESGHWVQIESANEVNAALVKFLSNKVSSRDMSGMQVQANL